jgi:hypothetical protein
MQHDAPALASFRPDVPRRLAAVIHRAMARDVSKRFPDVATFMQALESVGRDDLKLAVGTPPEGLITRVGFPRPTPAVLTPMLPRPRERRRMRIGIAMGVALVATAAVAASLWTSGGAERRLARPAPSTTRPDPNADRSPRQANAPGAIPASRDPSAGASGPQPPAAAPAPAAPAVAVAPAPPTAAKAAATPTPAGSSATAHGIRRSTPRPLSDSGRTEVESTVPAPAPRVTVPRPAVGRAGKISVDDF